VLNDGCWLTYRLLVWPISLLVCVFSDALMKYIYRAMSLSPQTNCTKLLQWHEKLYEKDGAGIIMRSLVDRKING
jgi:hypothetical protein